MRIAQVAPLIESVPPRLYGGTERVVSYLTEELVELGHDVTLFASGDSRTKAKLNAGSRTAMRLDPDGYYPVFQHLMMVDEVSRLADRFDIFHFHIDVLHFPLFRLLAGRTLNTLHGRLDLEHLSPVYRRFPEFPLVSVSESQKLSLPGANFVGTVRHGLPTDLYRPVVSPRGGYLAFLGRISPEKRVDRAIEIARQAGLPLRIAAKIDPADEAYFRERIAPLLATPGVEFIGEIGDSEKGAFLGEALALLFPIDWPEPFGLTMIEAMACGTPTIAFRNGSVPEIIDEGESGLVVRSVDEAASAVPRAIGLDRRGVRRAFDRRFTARRMAEDYLALYEAALHTERIDARELPVVGAVPSLALRPLADPDAIAAGSAA